MRPHYAESQRGSAMSFAHGWRKYSLLGVTLGSLWMLSACMSGPGIPSPISGPSGTGKSSQPATQTEPKKSILSKPSATSASAAEASEASAVLSADAPVPIEAARKFEDAVSMMSSGNNAGAEQAFKSLSAAYPAYAGPLLNLGILSTKAGKFEDAEKSLKSAIERNAQSAPAFNQLGIVYRRMGRFKDAEQAYERAVQIDPNYANAYLNLGVLCDLYLQQPQRALEAFERYLTLATTPDAKVTAWVTELKARLANAQRSAKADQ